MRMPKENGGRCVLFPMYAHKSSWSSSLAVIQFENSLRRHNHVGLVQALLLALAKGGKLSAAEDNAKKVMKDRIEQRQAQGGDMDED